MLKIDKERSVIPKFAKDSKFLTNQKDTGIKIIVFLMNFIQTFIFLKSAVW